MKHQHVIIGVVLIVTMAIGAPFGFAQDQELAQEEKEIAQAFFNNLGELVATNMEENTAAGKKATAKFLRSLGQMAAKCGDTDEETAIFMRGMFDSLGGIVENDENPEEARMHTAQLMRNIGRLAQDESGKKSLGNFFGVIATAVEQNGFDGDEKASRQFARELLLSIGDIIAEEGTAPRINIKTK